MMLTGRTVYYHEMITHVPLAVPTPKHTCHGGDGVRCGSLPFGTVKVMTLWR